MTVKKLLKVKHFVLFNNLRRKRCIGYSTKSGMILLDPRGRHNLARVFLHELIHLKKPHWSEKKVLRWEAKLWSQITYKEAMALWQTLFGGC